MQELDLDKLNSATKYPSIPTYHGMGEKGKLTQFTVDLPVPCYGTEKIDGTNARIIRTHDKFFLGSREELLYAQDDLIGNPALGIVEHLKDKARSILSARPSRDYLQVIYGEIYGGKVTAASKQYTGTQQVGFRVFDVASVFIPAYENLSLERISAFRENNPSFQKFMGRSELEYFCTFNRFKKVPDVLEYNDILPNSHEGMYKLLQEAVPITYSALDDTSQNKPEGMVLRSFDRSVIVKVRYEDYRKTLGIRS